MFAVTCLEGSEIDKRLELCVGKNHLQLLVTGIENYGLVIYCGCQLNEEEDSAIHTNGVEILKLNLGVKNALALVKFSGSPTQ